MKKILVLVSLLICLSLTACGDKTPDTPGDPTQEPTSTAEPTPTAEALTIRDISSVDLLKEMNVGISIGNSLDATDGLLLLAETSWGNPKISKAYVQALYDAGFNTVRIPVTWDGKVKGAANNYEIVDAWMNRVHDVVDYAYNLGMFVVLDTHHESWLVPKEENYEENSAKLKAIWTQIAIEFKDYDEHLIFEGMNEPREIGASYEWTGGTAAQREVINKLNQDFVDAVRATGGNNTLRHLVITTYGCNASETALKALKVPEDSKQIIVNVHNYSPYNFALNTKGTDQFSSSNSGDVSDINNMGRLLKKYFVDKGIAVMVNEMGSINKDNLEARIDCANYYVTAMKEYGIVCFWWDNGNITGDGERFGLIDRRTCEVVFPEIIKALINAAKK